ncbi:3,4-dihydroxy-2-butanone-4-phosphate synthase [Batrachochytrium dendrobatidis JEL423]|uniref:3,4-dihydroxy-2-butanone-4-phosphate synthase n=1 Tax=Batrachochytrium dendrobatidis (strain JEL423) TaxID=403673 RepID=A0A177WMA1_BATDL|nr:3,4-dihydroxy-2-butanone-4-phosphate synthase [Batrachochytrium dendrobatidis JEL423]
MPGLINPAIHVPSVSALFANDSSLSAYYDAKQLNMMSALESLTRKLVRRGFTTLVVLMDHENLSSYAKSSLASDQKLSSVLIILSNSVGQSNLYTPLLDSCQSNLSNLLPNVAIDRSEGQWLVVVAGTPVCKIAVTTADIKSEFSAPLGKLYELTRILEQWIFGHLSAKTRATCQLDCCQYISSLNAVSLIQKITTAAADALFVPDRGIIETGSPADIVFVRTPLHWKDVLGSLLRESSCGPEIAAVFKNGQLVYADDEFMNIHKVARLSNYYRNETIPQALDSASATANGLARGEFDSIESALESFRQGEFLVVVDNEDRENEGDLIIAGEDFTPEKAAFMIRYTSGLICAPATGEVLDRLKLPLMVENNNESLRTAYTVSTDALHGVTTGISAADRSLTIQNMANPSASPFEFSRPGHVFPLRAVPEGVLKRVGHTEAAVDLCRLTKKRPVAAICEIVLDDGKMARRDDLRVFASRFSLKMITIKDLVEYRIRHGV